MQAEWRSWLWPALPSPRHPPWESAVGVSAQQAQQPCAGTATATAAVLSTSPGQPGYKGVSITLPSGCATAHPVQIALLAGRVDGGQWLRERDVDVGHPRLLRADRDVRSPPWTAGASPVTWAFAPPATCQVTIGCGVVHRVPSTMWTGTQGGRRSALYFDVWVTTTSTSWVTWTVTFDLTNPYYGTTVTALGNSDLDGYYDGNTHFTSSNPINDIHRVGACSTSLVVPVGAGRRLGTTTPTSGTRLVRATTPGTSRWSSTGPRPATTTCTRPTAGRCGGRPPR